MSKNKRYCKFCGKDITADWPRLKKVCDSKECRDKQYHEHILYLRKKDRERRLKKKAANSQRFCAVCKKPLAVHLHALKKTCPECKTKWEAEVKRKKAIREKKRNKTIAVTDIREKKKNDTISVAYKDKAINLEFYLPQPGDFSQAEYEKQQDALNKQNGRRCVVCGKALKGNQRMWCKKCRAAVLVSADTVRCDDGYEYDQAGSNRYNWSLAGE